LLKADGYFMYVTGEFREAEQTADAIRALRSRGIEPDDLDVFSAEPVEFAPGVLDRTSRMSLIAVLGAIAALLSAVGFVYYTQHVYPLITGGMPIFSPWATGVIFYEFTMLGSVAATFVWFLFESGILMRDRSAPVPMAIPGSIFLRVRCENRQAFEAGECLNRAGAVSVSRAGESQ
jgi:Protein of unknown function (DUF3341)